MKHVKLLVFVLSLVACIATAGFAQDAALQVHTSLLTGGYFTCDVADPNTAVVHAEVTGSGNIDAIGVLGTSTPAPWYGIGGQLEGGWVGAWGKAVVAGEGDRFGLFGNGENGSLANYGVYGRGAGGNAAIGVYGMAFGGATNFAVYAQGDLAYTGSLIGPPSDLRFKLDVQPFEDALSKLMQLEVRSFEYRTGVDLAGLQLPSGRRVGFVAQELEEVMPALVADTYHPQTPELMGEKSLEAELPSYKSLKEIDLIPYLVRAIQQQQAEIDSLKAQIGPLQGRLADLETGVPEGDLVAATGP